MMPTLEWVAAALGVANVLLLIRRSLWNYPFGIAMVTLYFFVFLDAKLYSDALLQIIFLALQLYGWANWKSARGIGSEIPVGLLTGRARFCWAMGTAAAALAWGAGMRTFTDAAAPMLDAAVAGISVSAQCLQALRRVESWALWILVDILAVGLFASRGLAATAWLYVIFLALAVAGFAKWSRALSLNRAGA